LNCRVAEEIDMHRLLFVHLAFAAFACVTAPAFAQVDLDALIKAAKAEGEVVFYTGTTEQIGTRTGAAFTAKYGIPYRVLRLPGAQVLQRFAIEAEAGTFAVDFLFTAGGTGPFATEAIKKGWMEPVALAGIPAITSGQFPAKFVTGPTAIIQLGPWGFAYNTDKVSGADVPRDWPDILNAKFKGQILLGDPRASDAILDPWSLIYDIYGESFFTRLREQNPRRYAGNVPAANALAAGEGWILVPAPGQVVELVRAKGAPVAGSYPVRTTGVEMQIALTHRGKAKHPNAGRLFAHYVTTPEGNKVFNADAGSVGIFDTTVLPPQYERTKPETIQRKDMLLKLLGFQ
jgi:ABC-type Fe3+ transport system substrate-binding protein